MILADLDGGSVGLGRASRPASQSMTGQGPLGVGQRRLERRVARALREEPLAEHAGRVQGGPRSGRASGPSGSGRRHAGPSPGRPATGRPARPAGPARRRLALRPRDGRGIAGRCLEPLLQVRDQCLEVSPAPERVQGLGPPDLFEPGEPDSMAPRSCSTARSASECAHPVPGPSANSSTRPPTETTGRASERRRTSIGAYRRRVEPLPQLAARPCRLGRSSRVALALDELLQGPDEVALSRSGRTGGPGPASGSTPPPSRLGDGLVLPTQVLYP